MVEVGQRRFLGLLLSSTEEEGHGGFPVRQPLLGGLYRVEEQVVGVARIVGGAQQVFASLDAQGLDDLQSAADVGVDRAPQVVYEDGRFLAFEAHEVEMEVVDAGDDGLGHLVAEDTHQPRHRSQAGALQQRTVGQHAGERSQLAHPPRTVGHEVETDPVDAQT